MGLDTSHGCWHGSYGAFSRWRDAVAAAAGYLFEKNEHGQDIVALDWGSIQREIGDDLLGRWSFMPRRVDGSPDPLIVLLAHQDCGGEIQEDMCAPLADRLEELLPLLPNEGGGHLSAGIPRVTQQFIAGLRRASSAGEAVEFS